MTTATATKERPILFSGPMVRAILSGQKKITRRVIKPQPEAGNEIARIDDAPGWWEVTPLPEFGGCMPNISRGEVACPFGKMGDHLWVRESFVDRYFDDNRPAYRADYTDAVRDVVPEPKWTPSIHMPRALSRITLRIASVRAERLQDMTWGEVYAEGVGDVDPSTFEGDSFDAFDAKETAFDRFKELWDGLNAARGFGWDANPWVWRVEFRVIPPEGE